MGPLIHIGSIAALLTCARLIGYNLSLEIIIATVFGGVLIDGDKIFEIINNRLRQNRGEIPDITARCRILHSFLACPFAVILSLAAGSFLPFIAVLLHVFFDSFIPGVIKDGKCYPSHSRLKWVMLPYPAKYWKRIVTLNWPVTFPPEFNWIYRRLAPLVGIILLILSAISW